MPRRRLASRILLVSQARRLLLFKISYKAAARAGMSYWAIGLSLPDSPLHALPEKDIQLEAMRQWAADDARLTC